MSVTSLSLIKCAPQRKVGHFKSSYKNPSFCRCWGPLIRLVRGPPWTPHPSNEALQLPSCAGPTLQVCWVWAHLCKFSKLCQLFVILFTRLPSQGCLQSTGLLGHAWFIQPWKLTLPTHLISLRLPILPFCFCQMADNSLQCLLMSTSTGSSLFRTVFERWSLGTFCPETDTSGLVFGVLLGTAPQPITLLTNSPA